MNTRLVSESSHDPSSGGTALAAVSDAESALREALLRAAHDPVGFALDEAGAAELQGLRGRVREHLAHLGLAAWAARGAAGAPTTDEAGTAPSAAPANAAAEGPRSPKIPVTPALLERLQQGLQATVSGGTEDRAADAAFLRGVLDALGPTPDQLGWRQASSDIDALDTVMRQVDRWGELPQAWNFEMTAYATKRARAAQEAVENRPVPGEQHRRIVGIIKRLSLHSQVTRPGFVIGLGIGHKPEHGTWLADAFLHETALRKMIGDIGEIERPDNRAALDDELRRLVEEVHSGLDGDDLAARVQKALSVGVDPGHAKLVNLLLPHLDVLVGRPALAATRKAVQAAIDEMEQEAATDSSPIPESWPGFVRTEGRRAVIVGGEPRPLRVDALKRAFRFEAVDWIPNSDNGQRRIQALVSRMKSGSVDLVIALRAFSSHKAYDAIFDATDIQCDRVLADTYGVTQVRLAVERLLASPAPAP